jgi:hypothetical protein
VEWAKQRGGVDAFKERSFKKDTALTQEEKEQKKPFWERTYIVAKQPFKFERKFINDYMKRADFVIKDNESAYFDYKKRALFPRIADNNNKYNEDDAGEELGFIEHNEKQINDLYKTFVGICKQIREDSYRLEHLAPKHLYFFVKLYVKFKEMVPYMQ